MSKLPTHFTFKVRGRGETLQMKLIGDTYYCTGVYENITENSPGQHSYTFTKNCVDEGVWVIVENLDEPVEPELVYPFTFVLSESGNTYTVNKVNGIIKLSDNSGTKYSDDLYSENSMKKFIKSGAWIIKSVGKPIEAPTSDDSVIKLGSFQFDTKDALESIKELTEAVKDLAHAYDYLNVASEVYKKRLANV